MPTLYLIDGSAYIYRAFFALPPLSNSKGLQTHAVYGFTTMMLKVLRDHRPSDDLWPTTHLPKRLAAAREKYAEALEHEV